MSVIKDILARKYTCHLCGKKLKVDEIKYDVETQVWITEGKTSPMRITLCADCFKPINDIFMAIRSKRMLMHKDDKHPDHFDIGKVEDEW